MRKKQKDWIKDMAYQRIVRLFELAEQEFKIRPDRSDKYVQLARRIGMRYRVRMPIDLKQKMCKYCHTYIVQGVNARTRLSGTCVTTTCSKCGKQMRIPY